MRVFWLLLFGPSSAGERFRAFLLLGCQQKGTVRWGKKSSDPEGLDKPKIATVC